MTIRIKNLTFEAIVGILPFERETPQSVCIDVKIHYDFNGNNMVDYAHLCHIIKENMMTKHYFLLEEALDGLYQLILFYYPHVTSVKLKIFKPTVLKDAIVGVSHTFVPNKN